MKKIIFIGVTLMIMAFLFYQVKTGLRPGESIVSPNVIINGHVIKIEIADDFDKQTSGLSGRPVLGINEGMLFIFNNKQVRRFWMKNMNFPLDIVWLDTDKVVNIGQNLPPEGESPAHTYSSVAPVNNVLEINAGLAAKYDLKIGDKIIINY